MDKKPLFVATWFGAATTSLIFSFCFLWYVTQARLVTPKMNNFSLYVALPANQGEIQNSIDHGDARAKIIENFFRSYNSNLAKNNKIFVSVADKYQLDYRLLPAISMQESNGGKKIIDNSFNPFGFGIYGSKVVKFSSWEEGIETVGKTLRQDYLNLGLKTPDQIMTKYTPPSLAKGGSWAKGVKSFMEELR